MALSASSILFHWSAEIGPQDYPSRGFGGEPVAARTTVGGQITRDGMFVIQPVDTPRFEIQPMIGDRPHNVLMVGPAVTNDAIRSAEFDNAAWTKTRASITTADEASPGGTLVGAFLKEDGTASNTHMAEQTITVTANQVITVSCFAKPRGRDWLQLRLYNGSDAFQAFFNVATGVVGTSNAGGSGSVSDAFMEAVGDGWYRCYVVGKVNAASTSVTLRVGIASADNTPSYNGNNTDGLNVWGADLTQADGLIVPHIETTSAAATEAVDKFHWLGHRDAVEMAIWGSMLWRGTPDDTSRGVFKIGTVGDTANPYFRLLKMTNGDLQFEHHNGTAGVSVAVAAVASIGELVEFCCIVNSNGSIRLVLVRGDRTISGSSTSSAPSGGLNSRYGDGLVIGSKGNGVDPDSLGLGNFMIVKRGDIAATTSGGDDTNLTEELRTYALRVRAAGEVASL